MRKLIIDSFAGGGGTSCGIEMVFGRSPDVAINHDHGAMVMHEHNHPDTLHIREDVWKTDLRKVARGRQVGLLWASVDCTHFSRARGSKPVRKRIRGLAWVVARWARELKPDVIILENVREFTSWGPTTAQVRCGRCGWSGTYSAAKLYRRRPACPECNSVRLKATGHELPEPTKQGLTFNRWVGYLTTAGYDVQWRDLNASDFGSPTNRHRLFVVARRDGKSICWPKPTHGSPVKHPDRLPWRTAAECIDWSIPVQSIFDRKKPLAEKTLRRIAYGIKRYVIESATPFLVPLTHSGERRSHPVDEPVPTITTANRGELGLCSVTLQRAEQAAYLIKHYGGVVGVSVETPLPTTTQRGTQTQLLTASLQRYYGKSIGSSVEEPLGTLTEENKSALMTANLVHFNHGDKQWSDVAVPMRTITSSNHAALTFALLAKYFGTAIGQPVDDPVGTLTSKDRYGLVCCTIAGNPYVVVDIGMRMLTARELANCQGFPPDYWLPPVKTHAVARIGNSVPPQLAAAVIRANFVETTKRSKVKARVKA